MRRLYLRIYLAVLASLVVFALIAGIAWRIGAEAWEPRREQTAQLAGELVAELLPATPAGPDELKAVLEHWHERARVDLSLYSAGGELLASAGRPIERGGRRGGGWGWGWGWGAPSDSGVSNGSGSPDGSGGSGGSSVPGAVGGRGHGGPPAFAAQLPDGRELLVRRSRPAGQRIGPGLPGFLFVLLAIAVAVGITAYPVVRRLTARIERLQRSVDALGAGDLSARVRVEGRDEVAALAASFNRSAGRIEALVRSQRDLLANASHELRSPLARIRMALALLPPDTSADLRDEVARDIAELDQLIDEILLASRLDAQVDVEPARGFEEVDLAGLCAEECARVGAAFALQGAAPLVRGDPRLLRRMIRNLLENAVRYGDGKPVEAMLADPEADDDAAADQGGPSGDRVILRVCDRGAGVPPDERDAIFEPFHRVRGASERHGGVGLGLALARRIAGRHGATLDYVPREGGGSCFAVTFRRQA